MARPTKLNGALIARAAAYDFVSEGDPIPTIEGLALHLQINRDTVYDWRKTPTEQGQLTDDEFARKVKLHLRFSDIVSDILMLQGRLLIRGGLKGNFNANITKLILSGKHGYVERQELTGAEGTPLMPIGLDAAIIGRRMNGKTSPSTTSDS